MSPHTEVFQAVPFDASYEATLLLIAAGDAEEGRPATRRKGQLQVLGLVLGLLVGFFYSVFHSEANFFGQILSETKMLS
jgi:uncharacterized membrane protein YccC